MKRLIHTAILTAILQVLGSSAFGLAGGVDEYLLKAVFFERFTRFVDYGIPEPDGDEFFAITVFGENPFGNRLEQVYKDYRILNKKVKIVYAARINEIGTPDILYIGKDKKAELEDLLVHIQGFKTITIADSPAFSASGVMINLQVIDEKIRFEIDVEAAAMQNIKFDRILLINAIIVKHQADK
ncbi:MAG: YfiR family protein [Mangrovibacterium sp.]